MNDPFFDEVRLLCVYLWVWVGVSMSVYAF